MDVLNVRYPRPFVNPDDPYVRAAYCPQDNEIAQFNRILNRCSTGAVYDLVTRTGTPLVGPGGGVYAVDQNNTIWQTAAAPIPVTAAQSSYALEIGSIEANPTGTRYLFINGSVDGYECRISNTGVVSISFDRATMSSTAANFANGKGRMRVAGLYDGVNQHLVINGVLYDSDAVVPDAPDGFVAIGEHGEILKAQVYGVQRTLAQERAAYVEQFAKRVLWQWQPRDCGEGPAGGILTGSYSGVGGWTCPLGAATMGFVWRPDLSAPGGGRLCLTDTQAVNMNRIDFEFGSRPLFGTWVIEYTIRDPATDSPVIGFTPRRGVDPQAAASTSYWCWMRTAAGPWWRVSMGYENNTAVPIDSADAPNPGPNAGDRCIAVVSRDVDGTVQTWNYVPNPRRGWWWTTATGNHVTTLAEGCITVAPRGSYIERISWLQGAASPHELGIRVP